MTTLHVKVFFQDLIPHNNISFGRQQSICASKFYKFPDNNVTTSTDHAGESNFKHFHQHVLNVLQQVTT